MTDKEHAEAAWNYLTKTTDSYPKWKQRGFPSNTNWARAKAEIDAIINASMPPPPDPTPVIFDKYASPSGSDTNAGTLVSPYRTFAKLVDSLQPGQTGALRGGSYNATEHILRGDGTPTQRLRVTCYPGELPIITGKLTIDSAYLTLDHLEHNGAGGGAFSWQPGLLLDHMHMYQNPRINSTIYLNTCDDGEIRYCKLHDFGSNGHFDHGIYAGKGKRMHIHHNWIWNGDNGWGIQVYSDPSTSVFEYNVIDRCGSGFVIADGGTRTCYDNRIYRNVVANSVGTTYQAGAIVSGVGPVAGSNNQVIENCGFNNAGGIGGAPNVIMTDNFTADPQFVDAANHNYAVKTTSPLASWGLWDGT